ncbi:TPA: hypothetical protein ACL71Q_001428 [Streptococcus pneumoniae]|uniref:hypothetical protein n=1 Tax=Streptococcus pneumoniae TaxID=1313 RepID=UPI000768D075|nr:hypothetical protein [Streptococcus pneumoniae]MDV8173347.1 hypothetical protein [Streptococcus pneumoniae]MDV8512831.1 hypothetical protein [Streptococcus pneumoniae]SNI07120.1 phage protein [Streptococcus pneumoniae]SNP31453.1 phage protein [Streptococcus pneumoniae]VJY12208.1 phage protein [Streptococcus pneumoniae]
MAKNILMDLAFENLHKCMGISDWKESDEVILVSSANKEQIESDESYHSAGKCNYLGKRICIFCEQVKRNNYITLHIVEFLKKQYGQGRPDYIEALNDLDGLVEVSYREAIERFLEDEVR